MKADENPIRSLNLFGLLLIILFLLFCIQSKAQKRNQEATVFVYNIGLGGITSGIGSCINKPKGVKCGKAFLKGFWQGSLGGLLNYSSKKVLYLVYQQQNTFYALPATILNAAGFSIMENAALYKPFLQNWSLDYGCTRIGFSFNKKLKIKVQLLPQTIFATAIVGRYGQFDLETSLLTGTVVFKGDSYIPNSNNTIRFSGFSKGRAFYYNGNLGSESYFLKAHETVHYFQFREYQIFNTWFRPIKNLLSPPKLVNEILQNYVYLDLPYFWLFYRLEGHHSLANYFRNFYEFEAERFSRNRTVPIR